MVIFITLGIALMAAALASFDTWLYILVSRKTCVYLFLRFKTCQMELIEKYDRLIQVRPTCWSDWTSNFRKIENAKILTLILESFRLSIDPFSLDLHPFVNFSIDKFQQSEAFHFVSERKQQRFHG